MTNREEATGRILIRSRPGGDAPLEIRKAWVIRETYPCYPYIGYPAGTVKDVVTGRNVDIRRKGVLVPQDQALEVLTRYNRAAVRWWADHGFPQRKEGKGQFFFTEDEYVIVSGVVEAPLRVFENIRRGHWRQMPG